MASGVFSIINLTNGAVVARRAGLASGIFQRMKGLLGTQRLEEGCALILDPCTSIHTFFMKYPIDVIVVGHGGETLAVYHSLRPYRISKIHLEASRFVELPAGAASKAGVGEGDKIEFEEQR